MAITDSTSSSFGGMAAEFTIWGAIGDQDIALDAFARGEWRHTVPNACAIDPDEDQTGIGVQVISRKAESGTLDNVARLLYREALPKPELAHAIDCLWSVNISPEGAGSHWVLPDGSYSLAVGVKGAWYVHLREPVLAPFLAPCQPDEEIVGIRLRPGIVPHAAMPSIRRRLRQGQTAAETLAILQDAVRVEVPDPERRIDRMVSIVREGHGRIALSAVAESVQLSPRHLERLCLSTVGLRPKGFARVARLQAVVRGLIAEPHARLADCAAEFGFTDQTHMTREFSTLGHLSPAAYLRMIRDVAFILANRSHTSVEFPS